MISKVLKELEFCYNHNTSMYDADAISKIMEIDDNGKRTSINYSISPCYLNMKYQNMVLSNVYMIQYKDLFINMIYDMIERNEDGFSSDNFRNLFFDLYNKYRNIKYVLFFLRTVYFNTRIRFDRYKLIHNIDKILNDETYFYRYIDMAFSDSIITPTYRDYKITKIDLIKISKEENYQYVVDIRKSVVGYNYKYKGIIRNNDFLNQTKLLRRKILLSELIS